MPKKDQTPTLGNVLQLTVMILVVQKTLPENISSPREAEKAKIHGLKPCKHVEDYLDQPSTMETSIFRRILYWQGFQEFSAPLSRNDTE